MGEVSNGFAHFIIIYDRSWPPTEGHNLLRKCWPQPRWGVGGWGTKVGAFSLLGGEWPRSYSQARQQCELFDQLNQSIFSHDHPVSPCFCLVELMRC